MIAKISEWEILERFSNLYTVGIRAENMKLAIGTYSIPGFYAI